MKSKNVRTFELKLGKRALIIFVLGMSCLLFVVFLLGIQMGKMMDAYPEKIARGLPRMIMERFGWIETRAETEVAANEAPKGSAKEGEEKVELTFYDTLAHKKKDVNVVEKAVPENRPDVAGGTSSRQPDAGSKPQNTVKPSDKPSEPAVKGKYQVQVVSLKEKEKAEHFCKKLASLGYTPRIITAELHDRGKWFRVVLDDFDNHEQAQKATDVISKKIIGVNCVIKKKND
jgi:cell division septation protein DedD